MSELGRVEAARGEAGQRLNASPDAALAADQTVERGPPQQRRRRCQ